MSACPVDHLPACLQARKPFFLKGALFFPSLEFDLVETALVVPFLNLRSPNLVSEVYPRGLFSRLAFLPPPVRFLNSFRFPLSYITTVKSKRCDYLETAPVPDPSSKFFFFMCVWASCSLRRGDITVIFFLVDTPLHLFFLLSLSRYLVLKN